MSEIEKLILEGDFLNAEKYINDYNLEMEIGEKCFYYAIIKLHGVLPFDHDIKCINQVEIWVEKALAYKLCPKYMFLLSIIRYDFYYRKMMYAIPSFKDSYKKAVEIRLTLDEVNEVYRLLKHSWREIFPESLIKYKLIK